jgi:alanyl aminopeptidase
VGVEEGGAAFFDRLAAAREEIDDAYFREASVAALGAVRDPSLARRALDYAMAEGRPASETARLVQALAANRHVGGMVWEWVRANFPAYAARIPAQWRRATPDLAAGTCSPERIAEAEALFAEHGALAPGHEQALAQTTERVRLCHALAEAKAGEVAAALAAREP